MHVRKQTTDKNHWGIDTFIITQMFKQKKREKNLYAKTKSVRNKVNALKVKTSTCIKENQSIPPCWPAL